MRRFSPLRWAARFLVRVARRLSPQACADWPGNLDDLEAYEPGAFLVSYPPGAHGSTE